MKFFTNKSIWSKIIIVLIFIILFQFIVAKPTLASGDIVEFGGKLLSPVVSLVVTLGDAVLGIIHSSIMGVDNSLLEANLSSAWYEILGTFFKGIVMGAIVIASVVLTGGLAGIALAAAGVAATSMFGDAVFNAGMGALGISSVSTFTEANLPETMYLPVYSISPEEIFQGKILMFNVDFFNDGKTIHEQKDSEGTTEYYYYFNEKGEKVATSPQDMGSELRATVSKWYVSIRNIALVCMMVVLIYIGIRMLLSSVSSDKAKYKQMLQDWFVGLLLLFLMHYIMAFSVTIVSKLTSVVSASVEKNAYFVNIPDDDNGKLSEFIDEKMGLGESNKDNSVIQEVEINGETEKMIVWPTNLLGSLRIKTQLANWGSEYIGFAICFVILVMFTLFFVFTYLKRVLYMAFLTIIAPMVALTYPIDKLNDGSAQGFDKWFKEYIFNLLIQPMHLLLYFILVTSAFNLAGTNLLYSIVAIGFMIPAEKLLRSFFGFEKAHTPGMLAGPAGAALTMSAISKIGNLGKGSKGGEGKSGDGKDDSSKDSRKPRMKGDLDTEAALINGDSNGNNNSNAESTSDTKPDWNPQLTDEQKDDLVAEGINPGDNEYDQYLSQHGIEKDKKQTDEAKGEEMPKQKESLEQESSKNNKKKSTLKNRAGRKARAMAANVKARQINGIKKAPGQAIRFIGKTAGAAALGSMALAAGVVTGDPNKAFSYATTGAAAGYTLGGNLAGRPAKNLDNRMKFKDPKAEYNKVYNGRKYEEMQKEEYQKKFKKENKEILMKNFDKEKVKKMLEEGGDVDKYVQNGVDNIDDIISAQKMVEDKHVSGVDEAIAVAKYAKRVGDDYDGPKAKEWRDTFAEEFQDKSGLSATKAKQVSKSTMGKIEKFNKNKKYNYK